MAPTRIQLRLADGLGLSQAVRAAAQHLAGAAGDAKVAARAEGIASAAAAWQERLNEIVVRDADTREALTGRSRRLREATEGELAGGRNGDAPSRDALELAELVLNLGAREAAHWRVVRRLARTDGDKAALELADEALAAAAEQERAALKAIKRLANR